MELLPATSSAIATTEYFNQQQLSASGISNAQFIFSMAGQLSNNGPINNEDQGMKDSLVPVDGCCSDALESLTLWSSGFTMVWKSNFIDSRLEVEFFRKKPDWWLGQCVIG